MSTRPGWAMPALLGASLLLNLALGGYVAGALLRGDHSAPPPSDRERPPIERPEGIPELSREDRREVRRVMRQGLEAASAELATRRAAEQHFAEVLRADPFDRAAAAQALQALRDADASLRARLDSEVVGSIDGLSADQRAWVAWIVSGPRESSPARRRNGDRPEDSPPR